jgi:uncharacterized protein (TIGR03437 family)
MFTATLSYLKTIRSLCVAGALACATAAYGQGVISTVAGAGFVNNQPATESRLTSPAGVAVDASGNVYIAASTRIVKVDHASGILSVVAGGGSSVYNTGDGPALSVRVLPTTLAIDQSGNVLFLDSSRLRKLNLQLGTVTTLAGTFVVNSSTGDGGPAVDATLNSPQQFCLDSKGNIYIVELAGYVRRIDATSSVITTVAGNGGPRFAGDGDPATAATLIAPTGIAVDSSGNLYISDTGDFRIRKITAATQIITTIAGTGHGPASGDGGSALAASFDGPYGLAVDSHANVYALDKNRVRLITAATGRIATIAGNGQPALAGDGGPAVQAQLNGPTSLALDSAGDLYIADTGNQRVRVVAAASGVIQTFAGTSDNGDGGLAAGAVLATPTALAVDAAGDLFIGGGNVIRKVDTSGIISTIAGGGNSTQNGVAALQAQLNPLSMAVDSAGNLYVGEPSRVVRIDTAMTVTTIAGTGVAGYSGDGGVATSAQVNNVNAVAVDPAGDVLIADFGNARVRRIAAATGIITTVAGNGQTTYSGIGGNAAQAGIGSATGVAVDPTGNIYISSTKTYFLFKVSPAGTLSIAAGVGGCGYLGDGGPGTTAAVCQPLSLASDTNGNIFIGDNNCYCVRELAQGTGIIQTVAGVGSKGYDGDGGPATQAHLQTATALAVSGTTLYIADVLSGVVRGVTPDTPPALPGKPSFSALVSSASFVGGALAPGELVSFFGNYLGQGTPVVWNGTQTYNLGGVQVFFDGIPAPLIYVAAGQVNAIVPYAAANPVKVVNVETPGGTASGSDIPLSLSSPAVFPNAIVNQDNTLNGPAHPAPTGSIIVMYGTGLGATNPASVDGVLTALSDFPKQVYQSQLIISQNPLFSTPISMEVLYQGPAPGLVAGVFQINARIPAGASPGQNAMEIESTTTSLPITVYVQ